MSMKIFKPADLVQQQKGSTSTEDYALDLLHDRTHYPLATPSSQSSICHPCSTPALSESCPPLEPVSAVGSAINVDSKQSGELLSTQGKHEGATSRPDQTDRPRKRSRACLNSPSRYESNLRVTRSSARKSRRQTRSSTKHKEPRKC